MSLPSALKIFGENRINENSTIAVTSGDTTKTNIFDQKRATLWQSSGSSDYDIQTVDITFKNSSGGGIFYPIDAAIILNMNWKYFTISSLGPYHRSVNNPQISEIADSDYIYDFATARTYSNISFNVYTTQIANAEKCAGEIKLVTEIMTLNCLTNFERKDIAKQGDYYTSGGALVRWKEYQKFSGVLTIENMTLAQRDILIAAIDAYEYLTFVFYEDFDATAVYEVAITATPTEVFNRKTQMFNISLEVKER